MLTRHQAVGHFQFVGLAFVCCEIACRHKAAPAPVASALSRPASLVSSARVSYDVDRQGVLSVTVEDDELTLPVATLQKAQLACAR